MLDFHPFTVQFAIVLLTVSVLFDILAVTNNKPHLHIVGWWNLFLGFLAVLFAVITGLYAKNNASFSQDMFPLLSFHQYFGLSAGLLFTLIFVWRSSMHRKITNKWKTAYIILASVSVLALLTTGFLGGQLVFHHGANVEAVTKQRDQIQKLERQLEEKSARVDSLERALQANEKK